MHGSRGGGQGVWTHCLKNHKYFGFLSNTGPNPWKITKLPSQPSMLSYHGHARETSFKWWWSAVFGSSLPSSTKKKQKQKQKNLSKLDPSDKTFWICPWALVVLDPPLNFLALKQSWWDKIYLYTGSLWSFRLLSYDRWFNINTCADNAFWLHAQTMHFDFMFFQSSGQ